MIEARGVAFPVIRVAIIGYGYWGPNYARLLNTGLQGARLVACVDSSESRLSAFQRQYRDTQTFKDHRELISSGIADAVIVATPTATHKAISQDCLLGGLHVLVEKPMATTVADCEQLTEAASASGRTLMVGHTFIFNPAVRQVRHYIESGALGKVLYCYFQRTGLGPIRQDVSSLWDLAPHDISILNYWLGKEPREIVARGQYYLKPGTEDVVFLTLGYDEALIASLHVSWLDPVKTRRAAVVGDRKMVIFEDTHATEKLRVYDKGVSYQPVSSEYADFVAAVRDGDILIPHLEPKEPLREQLAHFIECVSSGRRPITDAESGTAVVRILEAAQRELEAHVALGARPT